MLSSYLGDVCPPGTNRPPPSGDPEPRATFPTTPVSTLRMKSFTLLIHEAASTRSWNIPVPYRHITISSAQRPSCSPRFLRLCFHHSILLLLYVSPLTWCCSTARCWTSWSMIFPVFHFFFHHCCTLKAQYRVPSVITGTTHLLRASFPPLLP